jgi:hypothetical protein
VEIVGRGVVSMMGSGSMSGVYACACAVDRLLERVRWVRGTVLQC